MYSSSGIVSRNEMKCSKPKHESEAKRGRAGVQRNEMKWSGCHPARWDCICFRFTIV